MEVTKVVTDVLSLILAVVEPGLDHKSVEQGLVCPYPVLVLLGALLGPDLLDPVLVEVGLFLVVLEVGVGKPGLYRESAKHRPVLTTLCPGLVLGALGLGPLGGIALDEVLLLCPGLVLYDVLLGLVLSAVGLVLVLGILCLG